MIPSKRHLPLLVEDSISKVGVLRTSLVSEFDRKVRLDKVASGGTITCTSGCAWCCYHPVSISIFEGISIYRWLTAHGRWTLKLKEQLQKSSKTQLGITPDVWLKSLIPCPLLGTDNKCTAYAARPLICRVYYATSDPHYCHPHRLSRSHTSLVPRDQVVDSFHTKQEEILRKHKLQVITIPIGAAVLMAEKICTGEVDLDAFDGSILKEYEDSL
jgi:Fe-S-cluster containining protein